MRHIATGLVLAGSSLWGLASTAPAATQRKATLSERVAALWDCAALLPILSEAGASFTDWNGVATILGGNAVSTNAHVLDEVLAALRGQV